MKQDVSGFRELRKVLNLVAAPNNRGVLDGVTAFSLLTALSDGTGVVSIQQIHADTGRRDTATYRQGQLLGVDFAITPQRGYIVFTQ